MIGSEITGANRNIRYTMPPCDEREIDPLAKWIAPDPIQYPQTLKLPETVFVERSSRFTAAEFKKCVAVPPGKNPVAHIGVFADTKFRLTINGVFIGVGPVAAGGDYDNRRPMPKQYDNRYDLPLDADHLAILAEVQTPGAVQTDYSCGRCGLILSCVVTYDDRKPFCVVTDESWLVRVNPQYTAINRCDLTHALPDWEPVYVIPQDESVWNLAFAAIPMLEEEHILPIAVTQRHQGEHRVLVADFKRIYSAYLILDITNPTDKPLTLSLYASEYAGDNAASPTETVVVPGGRNHYRSFRLYSVGTLAVKFAGDAEPDISLSLAYTHYPYDPANRGNFSCSDAQLNAIYTLGREALEMCRQTLHLDSPLHQETLGCTGDYAIESLMTHMTYGDMRLTRLDLQRTADYLVMSGGVMFHTTYSLIWVSMLYDYYRYTGDAAFVRSMLPALKLLLDRFEGYKQDEIICNPPNYMFVDWGELDGYNLHHPPAALGQTVMNAFYRLALLDAVKLYRVVGETARADACTERAKAHKQACVERFYDPERGLFYDGLCAPELVYTPNTWLPENAEKHYCTRHANTMAVLCGFIEGEDACRLMERVVTQESLDGVTRFDLQPYFMHYVLQAVHQTGLFDRHGLRLIHWWDKQVIDSPKGMKEGWNAFQGDHSHAWGATPTYTLPVALSGFEMLEAGFGRFRLTPKRYGLESVKLSIPTPWGLITIAMQQASELPAITVPDVFRLASVQSGSYDYQLRI